MQKASLRLSGEVGIIMMRGGPPSPPWTVVTSDSARLEIFEVMDVVSTTVSSISVATFILIVMDVSVMLDKKIVRPHHPKMAAFGDVSTHSARQDNTTLLTIVVRTRGGEDASRPTPMEVQRSMLMHRRREKVTASIILLSGVVGGSLALARISKMLFPAHNLSKISKRSRCAKARR